MDDTRYPCPACGAPADLSTGCTGCWRAPDPIAAEVCRLGREVAQLEPEVERARRTYTELAGRLSAMSRRRAELAAVVRAGVAASVVARPAVLVGPVPPTAAGVTADSTPGAAETSTRTVQGLLFVLGGLLLGTAAVVFTAVAWAAVGVGGRALILAAFTALALAVPLLLVRRGLRGTAETFAAVGLLSVVLDGYAAWSVDLAGVAGWPGSRYAALVGGASAAVAVVYGRWSRLTGPWFAALLAAQPVLPLLAVEAETGAAGWAVVLLAVALLNLAVLVGLRGRGGVAQLVGRVLAGIGHVAALVGAASCALVPLLLGRAAGSPLLAGLPLLLVALAGFGAAWLVGGRALRGVSAGLLVPVLAAALLRPVAELRPSLLLIAAATVALVLAAAVRLLPDATGPVVPAPELPDVAGADVPDVAGPVAPAVVGSGMAGVGGWRTGARAGALLVAAGTAQVAALIAAALAVAAVGRSMPPWRGAGTGPDLGWGWQLAPALALALGATVLLMPRAARAVLATAGAVAVLLALPAGWTASWPQVLAVDLVGGVVLLLAVLARPAIRPASLRTRALGGAVLVGHGLLVALATPTGVLVALGTIAVVGLALAVRRGVGPYRQVAGVGLLVAQLALPGVAAVALFAGGAPPWWQARLGLVAAGLPLVAVLAARRHRVELTGYAVTGAVVAVTVPGLAPLVAAGNEPLALYAALAALGVALVAGWDRSAAGDHESTRTAAGDEESTRPAAGDHEPTRPEAAGHESTRPGLLAAGGALGAVAVLAALPAVLTALVSPYGSPGRVWAGVPPVVADPTALPAGLALAVLAVAAVLAGRRIRPPVLPALPLVAAALPVLLIAVGAPWPVLPATVLLAGSAALLLAALVAPRPALAPIAVPVGVVLVASGVVGLLATRAGTLAAEGVLLVVAVAVAVGTRMVEVRVTGCLAAVGAATALAVTAPLAGGLPLRAAAYPLLAVAALVLSVAAAITLPQSVPATPARAQVGRVLDAAAQAVALVAAVLAVEAARHLATVCVLWGAAVALRLLRRGEGAGRRWAFAGIAAGSELLGAWVLLAAGGVTVLEAYTVPASALALGAGLLALRTRPGLTSWPALGPGLVAALLPSLVSVLAGSDPQPWRRLLLGAAALGAVLAGASRRWQAPVLLGGWVLALLAVHELARGWDLLPRWIYLGAGGLALVGLAATYERRRRDLARLRAAVGRLS
ncbi:SCO7613 C-terminal domain-containing membrane protein [Micromonospora luteifusca]|uniref:SCO7613 C-terminal domain-containing membrane protein n=1 Tax=Micromonospora luteifusca TaxID=709860 RepID=UPI0033ABC081